MNQIKSLEELNELKPTIHEVASISEDDGIGDVFLFVTDEGFFVLENLYAPEVNPDMGISTKKPNEEMIEPNEAYRLGIINDEELHILKQIKKLERLWQKAFSRNDGTSTKVMDELVKWRKKRDAQAEAPTQA